MTANWNDTTLEQLMRAAREPRHRRSTHTRILVLMLLAVLLAAGIGMTVTAPARAVFVPTETMFVHQQPGTGAWMQSRHHLVAAAGSHAAVKINRADPGDTYQLRGAKRGTFRVEGITFDPATSSKVGWALRMHVRGTGTYVFCNRIA